MAKLGGQARCAGVCGAAKLGGQARPAGVSAKVSEEPASQPAASQQAEADGQGHLIHPIHLIHSLWGNCHLQLPFLVPRCLLAYR